MCFRVRESRLQEKGGQQKKLIVQTPHRSPADVGKSFRNESPTCCSHQEKRGEEFSFFLCFFVKKKEGFFLVFGAPIHVIVSWMCVGVPSHFFLNFFLLNFVDERYFAFPPFFAISPLFNFSPHFNVVYLFFANSQRNKRGNLGMR